MATFYENLIHRDESIDKLEKCLIEYNILTEPLISDDCQEQLVGDDQTRDKERLRMKRRRLFLWRFHQIVFGLAIIR